MEIDLPDVIIPLNRQYRFGIIFGMVGVAIERNLLTTYLVLLALHLIGTT